MTEEKKVTVNEAEKKAASNGKEKITNKDLKKVFWRALFGLQIGFNYERMQGLGYCFAMIPILKKLYKTKEEMKRALKVHLQFFNTTPAMSHLILGADIAMEEEYGLDEEAISSFKTSLMAPFAGIGDTVFVAIYRTVVFSIAAYMAMQGSVVGVVIPIITAIIMWWVRYKFTQIGYSQGKKIAVGMGGRLKQLTEGASILGLFVIGGLAPSIINVKVPYVFQSGSVKLVVQDMLDKILPGMVPLAIVFFSYWLLGKKKMNSTRLIVVLIILGIVLYNLQILA
ncbi:PTS system mannose/fructose/sorbose family transporter subunit IID [Clostridium sp. JN-9]|uniref:PTS system mannose/fructose/sorbose family transporter subunit IID n=1 Tax=Clostridium sp. JN-9 TaxID=2507159 RepID=UPI000FFE0379|nr:PTS system mannose/fructose/sorbose family transporter subunit IID [Clostridium sp. JN-9]QAT39554.1 PTS system mannose/fructose/sorbose family transporter subunit IID [Clostridium sp. JN-9]